jgi:uncharacterized membrane protein YfcA
LFAAGVIIGVVAVLGGIGGGVIFTPLMMGFTNVDSYIIRATGLIIAMATGLVAARRFLGRGLANIKIVLLAAVPYAGFAVLGALMKDTMGETGEAAIRLCLGLLVLGISLLLLFGGKRVQYPEAKNSDGLSERLGLSMSYYEESLEDVVHYKVNRAPVGIVLFCGVGFISGLFGLGAGWAMVPTLNLVMLIPLKVAAASSSVLISVGDTAAAWQYIRGGAIFPPFIVPCLLGIMLGAFIGSRIMIKVSAGFIRWIIIAVMLGSGVKLLVDGISMFS